MNRKMMIVCSLVAAAGLAASCTRTQEQMLVRAKSGPAAEASPGTRPDGESGKSAVSQEGSLREIIGAPQVCRSTAEDASGKIRIETDAAVEIPDIGSIFKIPVQQHAWDEKELEELTQALLGDVKLYEAGGLSEEGSAQRKPMEFPFAFKEEPLDPWAPEYGTVEKVYAVAETAQEESYRYELTRRADGGNALWIKRIDGAQDFDGAVWHQWFGWKSMCTLYPWIPDEKTAAAAAGMTEEEAKKIADKTAAGLELFGMEATAWEPVVEVLCARSGAPGKDDIMDYGYVFHYTRRLCGMPVTYTMIPGGSLAETDSDGFAWGYETLDVYVTKEGVDEIRFENQYEIGTAEIEPVKLLAFSDIMEVFETMTAVRESDVLVDRRAEQGDFAAPAYARTYHIDRITLGYTRIYDPCAKSKSGVLVPVWDFFGGYEEIGQDGETKLVWDENKSFLTVNAMDGTIVDRWLGY